MKKTFSLSEDNQCSVTSKAYIISDEKKQYNYFHVETLYKTNSLYTETLTHAHSHGYYTIICFLEGEGSIMIDFKEYKINPRTIFFIPPGQLHQLNKLKDFSSINFSFTQDFLYNMSHKAQNIIKSKIFPNRNIVSVCYINSENQNEIIKDCLKILHRYNNPIEIDMWRACLASLLSVFLFDVLDCGKWENTGDKIDDTQAYQVYLDFDSEVEQNFKCVHTVENYAKMMSLSLKNLNLAVFKVTGKSPYKLICERLVLEAKRMLYEQKELCIKEIAGELGFSDVSNFIKFFKRYEGMSPKEFRLKL